MMSSSSRNVVALAACLLFAQASSAFGAELLCGSVPEFTLKTEESSRLKGELNGKAEAISKLFGSGEAGAQIEQERKTLYTSSTEALAAQSDAYFQYVLCELVRKSTTLTDKEKVDIWFNSKKPLGESRKSGSIPSIDEIEITKYSAINDKIIEILHELDGKEVFIGDIALDFDLTYDKLKFINNRCFSGDFAKIAKQFGRTSMETMILDGIYIPIPTESDRENNYYCKYNIVIEPGLKRRYPITHFGTGLWGFRIRQKFLVSFVALGSTWSFYLRASS